MTKRAHPRPSRTTPIRITSDVYRQYLDSIAISPPETFAILGGHLDDPFLVTDFRFCPPTRTSSGDYDASAVHINIDHDFMNFVVDKEWKPAGKYMLGIWHSHPSAVTRPSNGDPATNTGDVVFFSSCLDHDDSPDRSWRYFLAPITTFTADGTDEIHGWVLKRGSNIPRRCHMVLDPFASVGLHDLLPLPPAGFITSHLAPLFLSTYEHDQPTSSRWP